MHSTTRRRYHPDRSEEPDARGQIQGNSGGLRCSLGSRQACSLRRFGHDGPAGNPFGGFSGGGFNINLEDLLGGDFFSGFFGGGRGQPSVWL